MRSDPRFLTDSELIASFAIREVDLELLLEALDQCTGVSNPHQLVIGPPGSGKTMLLLRLAAEVCRDPKLSGQFYPLVLPEEHYEISTIGEFFLACVRQAAIQEGEDQILRDDIAQLHAVAATHDDYTLKGHALAPLETFSDRIGRRLLVIVENLDKLFEQIGDRDAGWHLRKVLQTEPWFILFGSASKHFAEIDDPDHALYNGLRNRRLRPLTSEQCATLWSSVSGAPADPSMVAPVARLTNSNPRFIVSAARIARDKPNASLTEIVIGLLDQHTAAFKVRMEELPKTERRVYLALTTLRQAATARRVATHARRDISVTSTMLAHLDTREMVEADDGIPRQKRYRPADPLFALYYLVRTKRIRTNEIETFIQR